MTAVGLYLVPLMIGTRDVAFPRLNAFGYWSYLIGGAFLYIAFLLGAAPSAGWFSYVPLSGPKFAAGHGIDVWAQTVTFTEIAALVGAVEIIVTTLKQRAPGMSLTGGRVPIFVWSQLVASFMIVFAMPVVAVATSLLAMDRAVHTQFFNPSSVATRCSGSICSGSSDIRRSTSSSSRHWGWSPRSSPRFADGRWSDTAPSCCR